METLSHYTIDVLGGPTNLIPWNICNSTRLSALGMLVYATDAILADDTKTVGMLAGKKTN